MYSEKTKIKKYSVYLGKNAINETDSKEQKFSVSKLVVHSDFDYKTENFTHDIGMFSLFLIYQEANWKMV